METTYLSFHRLKMSNHCLAAQGGDIPFLHGSEVTIMHEQNFIYSKEYLETLAHENTLMVIII